MLSKNCCRLLPLPLLLTGVLAAQMSPNLTVAAIPTVKAARGATAVVSVKAHLPSGYHANSNTPTESYLIPLSLKWTTTGPLVQDGVSYPKGSMEKYSFSDKPLSVVTGDFTITTKFKVAATANNGVAAQNGVLRYQACDDHACYPPKNVPVNLTVSVE